MPLTKRPEKNPTSDLIFSKKADSVAPVIQYKLIFYDLGDPLMATINSYYSQSSNQEATKNKDGLMKQSFKL